MQIELRELQRALGITTILVTHDQREAMTMADRVVVMGQGRVQQYGTPLEIYRQPVNTFVADFIGNTNLVPVRAGANGAVLLFGQPLAGRLMPGGATTATLSVRPESIGLCETSQPGAAGNTHHGASLLPAAGTVRFVRDLGSVRESFVEVAGQTLTVVSSPHDRFAASCLEGDTVGLTIQADDTVVLPVEGPGVRPGTRPGAQQGLRPGSGT